MNTHRLAALLREIADALEEEEQPRARRRPVEIVPPPVDELAQAEAKRILKRKGILR